MIPVLKLKDADGNVIPVPAIQGEKGDPGNTASVNSVEPDAAGNISLTSDDIPYGETEQSVTEAIDSRQSRITASGLLKGDGAGGVTTAEAGTDYATRAQVTAKQDTIQAQGILKGLGTGTVSAATSGADYITPYKAGDSFSLRIQTAGYITGERNVHFYIPFSRPVYGNPTITVTSNGDWAIRSDGKYAFGGSAVTPTSITVTASGPNGIAVYAAFDNTTDAQNNAACGIDAAVQISFS